MDGNLVPFIHFLEDNQLIKFDILGNDDESFLNRFKIQKYVYIAKRLGLDLDYDYGLYIRGPYSSSLTNDYYAIAEQRTKLYDGISNPIPDGFNSSQFLDIVRDANESWLEIAATLMSRNLTIQKRDALISNVSDIKVGYTVEYIDQVLSDLQGNRLVTLSQ